uniref:Uncharacterized protein n=1 Tax=Anguilla anguilla TaxID=7936 RepID=A0A0E9Q9Y1_ANGAN
MFLVTVRHWIGHACFYCISTCLNLYSLWVKLTLVPFQQCHCLAVPHAIKANIVFAFICVFISVFNFCAWIGWKANINT